jgi:hypothetical protein
MRGRLPLAARPPTKAATAEWEGLIAYVPALEETNFQTNTTGRSSLHRPSSVVPVVLAYLVDYVLVVLETRIEPHVTA